LIEILFGLFDILDGSCSSVHEYIVNIHVVFIIRSIEEVSRVKRPTHVLCWGNAFHFDMFSQLFFLRSCPLINVRL
jgi:hypothetical protein